ncbi:hypothetical protein GOP47_0022606 [Adiantum capillus-veneris]|uniref:RWD domain-containing protein n=1 Tax=Adiantum capillus-veneris TaxID=13818 RepID=A0A9D4U6T2_ADICA|nr:hypothetical protein GOP47_0022606 [Adiantum capillus-veneris]
MEAADAAENRAAQSDEAEVLKSIYGEDCEFQDDNSYEILVRPSEDGGILPLRLCIYFPESYPATSEPVVEMEAPWLQSEMRQKLSRELHIIHQENTGSVIVFTWVEWIKEQVWLWEEARSWSLGHSDCHISKMEHDFEDLAVNIDHIEGSHLAGRTKVAQLPKDLKCKGVPVGKLEEKTSDELDTKELEELDIILGITHGAPFTEKRSTFQAHLACVNSVDQVETVMEALLRNRKIAGATHNIMAYRINIPEKGTVLQDCDDDGETAAGGRLLHLLQIIDAINVVVVVSRWFGGILLGPDRFKHINNAARSLLNACGYIKATGQSGASNEKPKSQSKAVGYKGKRR